MSKPSKVELRSELVAVVREELAVLERAQRDAQAAATHAEAKPENDKDTRALEQSYLARGQALRVQDLRDGLERLLRMELLDFSAGRAAGLSALVTVEDDDDGSVRRLFVVPAGGGVKLGGEVQAVTPESPLGRALVGKTAGDGCELVAAGRTRQLTVTDLR